MPGEHYLVLSALGPDRPGLVAEITKHLVDRGANVEDSRMAILGAEFGVLILASGTLEQLARVEQDRPLLEAATGLTVLNRRTKSPAEHRRAAARSFVVQAEALDHEGIVHAVAAELQRLAVNIVSLETATYPAPVTGSPLFRLEAAIDVPREMTGAQLRQALEQIARRENVDIEVRSLTTAA